MRPVSVPVTLPSWLWGRLATIADHRHSSVADVIGTALLALVEGDAKIRQPIHDVLAGTGAPGHRVEVLASELRAARAASYRAPRYGKKGK